MRFELGLEKPDINRARNSALTIGLAYVIGGLIPLVPYVFASKVLEGLVFSSVITLISLFIFGFFKSKVLGQNPLSGGFKMATIGGLAASAAFVAAKFFEHYF